MQLISLDNYLIMMLYTYRGDMNIVKYKLFGQKYYNILYHKKNAIQKKISNIKRKKNSRNYNLR